MEDCVPEEGDLGTSFFRSYDKRGWGPGNLDLGQMGLRSRIPQSERTG